MVNEHVLRGLDILRRVVRLLACDAFAPALPHVGDRLEDQDVPLRLRPERRLERRHERDPDPPQLDPFQLHVFSADAMPLNLASSSSVRSMSAAAAFCSIWWTLDAPGIATTLGLRISHASATCAADALCIFAISPSAAIKGRRRARADALNAGRSRRRLRGVVS